MYYLFSFVMSIIILISVVILQYVFHLQPCQLCYQQRYIWVTIGVVGLIGWLIQKKLPSLHGFFLRWLLIGLFIFSAVFALYHAGVVEGWWKEIVQCRSEGIAPQGVDFSHMDINNLQPAVSPCESKSNMVIAGVIPIPLLNVLASIGVLMIVGILMRRHHRCDD